MVVCGDIRSLQKVTKRTKEDSDAREEEMASRDVGGGVRVEGDEEVWPSVGD